MKRYHVRISEDALEDLRRIESYIAEQAGASMAASYVDRVLDHLERFEHAPERGARRDDLGPGLRVTNYRGRISILFAVEGDEVLIAALAYGGRPIENVLRERR